MTAAKFRRVPSYGETDFAGFGPPIPFPRVFGCVFWDEFVWDGGLPESGCQGLVAADIGGMVRGEAPQLDSTSFPLTETGAAMRDLSAAFRGAMPLNCTRDRQPTKPRVLYFSMRTGSI